MTKHASSPSFALLALAALLGCSGEVIIGTAEGTGAGASTTSFGATSGPTTTPGGTGGYPAGTGTVTVTDTITIPGCGSPPVTCIFTSTTCDCSALCTEASRTLRAVCTAAGLDTQQCDCYGGGSSVGSCTGGTPSGPYDVFMGCGGLGFGCCDSLLPVSP